MKKRFGANINLERIDLGKTAPLEWPLLLIVELSGYCNFRCSFCPHGTEDRNLIKEMMSIDLFCGLVDQLPKGAKRIKKLRYCGMGEMLTNPDAVEMFRYAKKVQEGGGCADCLELVTNGYLMNNEISSEIGEYLDRIVISIEGLDAETYAKVTGTRIEFSKLVDNIKCLYKNKGDATIIVKIQNGGIQTKEEEDRYYSMFSSMADVLSIENISDMWPGFETEGCDNSKFRYRGIDDNSSRIIHKKVCPQIFKSLQIYSNGDVVGCCFDWDRKNNLGNITEEPLCRIWNGDKLKTLQMKHLKLMKDTFAPCKDCCANDYADIDFIDNDRFEILKRLKGENNGRNNS